jgi:hypothetical protein
VEAIEEWISRSEMNLWNPVERDRRRTHEVLADDPRPSRSGYALHGDAELDRAVVRALGRPLVAGVGVS